MVNSRESRGSLIADSSECRACRGFTTLSRQFFWPQYERCLGGFTGDIVVAIIPLWRCFTAPLHQFSAPARAVFDLHCGWSAGIDLSPSRPYRNSTILLWPFPAAHQSGVRPDLLELLGWHLSAPAIDSLPPHAHEIGAWI